MLGVIGGVAIVLSACATQEPSRGTTEAADATSSSSTQATSTQATSPGGVTTTPSTEPSTSPTTQPPSTTSQPPATTTTTLPPVRIAAVGDTGTGDANQLRVAAMIEAGETASDYVALVLLGDLIYDRGNPSLVDERVLEPYAATLDGDTQLIPALGNHDVRLGREAKIMEALGAPGRWYSTRLGSALVVVLDSTRPDDPDQLAWLTAELAGSQDRWIIAAMHHPPYSAGKHGSHLKTRKAFEQLFIDYGVDLVLTAHDHDYQRSYPISGVTYVVSGGGANPRDTGVEEFTVTSAGVLHFLDLEISWDAITGTAVGVEGVIDRFTIEYSASNQP